MISRWIEAYLKPHLCGYWLVLWMTPFFGITYSYADALAPLLLQIKPIEIQQQEQQYEVYWKIPLAQVRNTNPQPRLPAHCRQLEAATIEQDKTSLQTKSIFSCPSLVGSTVRIDHISSDSTRVLLSVHLLDGRNIHQVLSLDNTHYTIPIESSLMDTASSYIVSGVTHLLQGLDHVLFVAILFVLVGFNRRLFWTITLFTVGHSITLTLASLDMLVYSQSLAEVFIAMSIVWGAHQLVNKTQAPKRIYLMAVVFGLLHGLGFASVLGELGLPQNSLVVALFSFNVGIEIGQLILIIMLYIAARSYQLMPFKLTGVGQMLPYYGIGCLAGLWFWQRMAQLY